MLALFFVIMKCLKKQKGDIMFTAAFQLFNTGFILVFLGIYIYLIVLFVKLARRGIVALDYYIQEKKRENF
jgi:hypothetical protein